MSPRPGPGFGSNLARRIATAAVAIPAILAVIFLAPPTVTEILVAVAVALGFREGVLLLEGRALRVGRASGLVLLALIFSGVAHPAVLGVSLLPLVAVLAVGRLLTAPRDSTAVQAAGATLLLAVYLGALGGCIAGLRWMAPLEAGPRRLLMLLAIVMGSDVLAFFVGYAAGRRPLAPAISPGKTIEGAVGGLLGGVAGALAVRWGALPLIPVGAAIGLGLSAAGLGIVGDLAESLFKRWAGVKDSGALLPGHGGMLDRLDSLLFGAPVLYYYFLCLH